MIFRRLLLISFVIVIVNLEAVLGGGAFNPLEKALILAAGICLVLTRPRLYTMLFFLFLMILTTFVSAVFTRNGNFSWNVYLLSLNQIVVPMLFMSVIPSLRDRDFVLRLAAWAPVACAFLGVFYDLARIHPMVGYAYDTGAVRFQGTLIAAFFGGFAMSGAIAAMLYADLVKRSYLWVAVANLLLLVLSGARVPVVVSAVICAVIFFRGFKGALQLKVLSVVLGTGVMALVFNTFGAGLVVRFADQSLSGRDLMWGFLESIVDQYGDFGVGFGHQMSVVPHEVSVLTGSAAAHNDFLRSAVEIGVVPAYIFYGLFMISLLWLWFARYRRDFTMFLGIVAYFCLSITDNTLASVSHFPILYITAYGALKGYQNVKTGNLVIHMPSSRHLDLKIAQSYAK